jgi:hypothetical protein
MLRSAHAKRSPLAATFQTSKIKENCDYGALGKGTFSAERK